jgi:mRNA interferase RelE/StbE
MWYDLRILPTAQRDLDGLSPEVARRIVRKLEGLRENLGGDVKRLVDFIPPYRLRVGSWRVLFDVTGGVVRVHRVRHRSQAY